MISLRYHIVSIAAVFLALAVGVVLGSTALGGNLLSGLAEDRESLTEQVANLEGERADLQLRLKDQDSFAASVGPKVVSGSLDKRTVVLISNHDARPSDRDAVRKLITDAGGKVVGEVQLTAAFADPKKGDRLSDIATRLQPSGVEFPTAGGPGTLAGALLGHTLLLDAKDAKPQSTDTELAAALSGLAEGGFIKSTGDVQAAQLAVVLVGGKASGEGVGDKAATVGRFATELDKASAGAVLAGTRGSASRSGAIGMVRADTAATEALSTVDNVDSAAGRVATLLALREQLEGDAGHYGIATNAQSPAPGVGAQGD